MDGLRGTRRKSRKKKKRNMVPVSDDYFGLRQTRNSEKRFRRKVLRLSHDDHDGTRPLCRRLSSCYHRVIISCLDATREDIGERRQEE